MTTLYKLQKDVEGFNGFGLPVSDQKYSATLTASTDTTLTAPSGVAIGAPVSTANNRFLAIVQVEYGEEAWMAVNATAAVPAGATLAATTSELIVGGQYFARQVNGGDVLHFITSGTDVDISVVFYSLPAS